MADLSQMFYGPNAGYAQELYERYQQDPASVDPEARAFFEQWQPNGSTPGNKQTPAPLVALPATNGASQPSNSNGVTPKAYSNSNGGHDTQTLASQLQIPHVVAAVALAHSIRERGHLGADLDPLGSPPLGDPALLPQSHGITEEDLARLPSNVVGGHAAATARNALEAITRLRAMYSSHISYEFDQVKGSQERLWLRDAVGGQLYQEPRRPNSSRTLLKQLTQVEALEQYLHQTFVGQKRFSIEGNDTLVPMLNEITTQACQSGTREVYIGMAHRGRLNVLAHVLKKPYSQIISEFMHAKVNNETARVASQSSGDVKYHLGAEQVVGNGDKPLKLVLAPNPSHLEYINPVIQGMARASQERSDQTGAPFQAINNSLAVVIHGDAAFPGEGIVAETMNLWNLRGYRVGGIIHIIVNNQIGFTTEPQDGRSTHFASDLAKGFEMPIIHVNADDPDACLTAVRLGKAYRDRFNKDIMIDLVGYRRWGHNEGDEPAFTQPQLYDRIRSHPTVREIYARVLIQEGLIRPEEAEQMRQEAFAALDKAKQETEKLHSEVPDEPPETPAIYHTGSTPVALSAEQLAEYNQALITWPEGFSPNPKLDRLLQRRKSTLTEGGIDWGQAEALAFAGLLAEGTPIRLSGQDAERGTFSHRHAVLHDYRSGAAYTPLQNLPQAKASFSIYNSPISEAAVLGFEYGYSVRADETLVLWEAQFGDFANAGQVIIDQFISSGRAKWEQESGLVLLLPHGYEGQGPEHSSARVERYLALCAGENWKVANCSTSGQYFHLLRQQAHELKRDPRPLVIFTPKSLLRHPLAASTLQELTQGRFQPVIDDHAARERFEKIQRVVLCTGKIGIDLLANPSRARAEDVAIVRVELLYPFPGEELSKVLASYPNLQEVVWSQEEPGNMGAWRYMLPRLTELTRELDLKLVARADRSTPATGFLERFQLEQEQLMAAALGLTGKA